MMASKGITGARNCFEGELGLFSLYHGGEYDRNALVKDLGRQFKGVGVEMKPYPCCKGTHSFVAMTGELMTKHRIKAADVREILITCPGQANLALPLEVKAHPRNPVDSQFSIPWAVAVVIARGRAGINDFNEQAIVSPDILEVCDRIRLDMEPGTEGRRTAVQVTMKDGSVFREQTVGFGAGGESVLPFSVYEAKFRDCVSYATRPIPTTSIDRVVELVRGLENTNDVTEIVRLIS